MVSVIPIGKEFTGDCSGKHLSLQSIFIFKKDGCLDQETYFRTFEKKNNFISLRYNFTC